MKESGGEISGGVLANHTKLPGCHANKGEAIQFDLSELKVSSLKLKLNSQSSESNSNSNSDFEIQTFESN